MASRLKLHEELKEILGSSNVYYQPPESTKLAYDCIIYTKNDIFSNYANNKANYIAFDGYELILIYRDPDSDLPKKILDYFQYCRLNRHYISDNLYHDAFNLYY